MPANLAFRWHGVQALEFSCAGYTLWLDPFFTRPALWQMPLRVRSNEALAARLAPQADAILVTHPHYDHLMDVPGIAKRTGALVCGSANSGGLLRLFDVPEAKFRLIQPGDRLELGPFVVEVLPSQHVSLPWLDGLVNGPLRVDSKRRSGKALRPQDYRMDMNLGFYIEVQGLRLLVCPGPARPCDVLFASTQRPLDYQSRLFRDTRPSIYIPVHWDNFFRPLDRPLTELGYPGLPRLAAVRRAFEQAVPAGRMLVPEVGRLTQVVELLA